MKVDHLCELIDIHTYIIFSNCNHNVNYNGIVQFFMIITAEFDVAEFDVPEYCRWPLARMAW